jgi:hypothetical protein
VFRRDGNRIVRVSDTVFEPFDDFCIVYHLLDLFPDGDPDWEPSFSYA